LNRGQRQGFANAAAQGQGAQWMGAHQNVANKIQNRVQAGSPQEARLQGMIGTGQIQPRSPSMGPFGQQPPAPSFNMPGMQPQPMPGRPPEPMGGMIGGNMGPQKPWQQVAGTPGQEQPMGWGGGGMYGGTHDLGSSLQSQMGFGGGPVQQQRTMGGAGGGMYGGGGPNPYGNPQQGGGGMNPYLNAQRPGGGSYQQFSPQMQNILSARMGGQKNPNQPSTDYSQMPGMTR
jgi:hypothetical protein